EHGDFQAVPRTSHSPVAEGLSDARDASGFLASDNVRQLVLDVGPLLDNANRFKERPKGLRLRGHWRDDLRYREARFGRAGSAPVGEDKFGARIQGVDEIQGRKLLADWRVVARVVEVPAQLAAVLVAEPHEQRCRETTEPPAERVVPPLRDLLRLA